jgi:hypothetical protein
MCISGQKGTCPAQSSASLLHLLQPMEGAAFHPAAHEHWICHTDHRAILATFFPCPTSQPDDLYVGSTTQAREFARPRLRYPKKSENHRFAAFSSTIRQLSMEKGLGRLEIDSEAKWVDQYEAVTEVMMQAAESAFERPISGNRTARQISSSLEVQAILCERHNINSILYSHRCSWAVGMRPSAASYLRRLIQQLALGIEGSDSDLWPLILTKLRARRNKLNKELFSQRKKEAAENDRKRDSQRMAAVLRGGSVKKNLFSGGNSVLTPLAVESQDGHLCTDPDEVNNETCRYFTQLYAKPPTPVCEKPWMETESVKRIKALVECKPFQWPQLLELSAFQSMLRKGNSRPSPGPDGWEKWIVKRLPEETLLIVMDLINYMIANSLSPPRIKSMLLNIMYKKGARTSLSNWRTVTFSNFLFNAPATWLNTCLLPYCADMGIIPDTQVATQIGVQTRDLTSFLAQLECWSSRHSQPLYMLKRDQMKGFDYLSPQGFYDALTAYGLPQSIAALDRSLQEAVTCQIRTAYGLAGPITLDGVTKQGGPLSPLKSTLTTSMGHRYLQDVATASSNLLTITTANAQSPHTIADETKLPITVVEATDDSFLIAKTLPALHELTTTAERFQFCYNWLTSWPKSLVMILNAEEHLPGETLEMPSISLDDPFNPAVTVWHDVEVTYDHCVFLGAKINDSKDRFDELREFITEYSFPRLSTRLPHNIVRRIVLGAIMPRIRALLTIQPVSHRQAEELDMALAQRVHQLLGFRFPPNISIMSLPVEMNGLGFPSISRMNRALCMEGLMRDLNHHIPAYRAMAEITMADWTCDLNRCCNPVSNFGRQLKDFARHHTYASKIPVAWIVAQSAMRDLPRNIEIIDSDQSAVMRGDISIRHVTTRIAALSTLATPMQEPNPSLPDWRILPLSSHTIRALAKHGITKLNQLGSWSSALTFTANFPLIGNLSAAVRKAMEAQKTNTIASLDGIRLAWLIDGPVDLAKPKELRELEAVNFIRAVAKPSRPEIQALGLHTWATDGSMRPNPRKMHETRTVTAAVTGPLTAALQIPGRTASILHGEALALVMAQTLADPTPETRIISDHLNSVKLLSSPAGIHNDKWIRKANGRSLYRWYAKLDDGRNIPLVHVKAHTGGDDSDSRLNGEADRVATAASAQASVILAAPEPTFAMDRQVLHSPADGYIEANIYRYVEHHLSLHTAETVYSQPSMRMTQSLYDPTPPPQYPYTKSLSSYSATVQLYARSGQLDVMATRFAHHLQDTRYCEFGCQEAQTMHHIFVECVTFASLRKEATIQAVASVKRTLESFKMETDRHPFLDIAESLFCDSVIWPASHSAYYLGWLPKLEEYFPQIITSHPDTAKLNRDITADLHIIAIRLAGRIWGQITRGRTARWRENDRT